MSGFKLLILQARKLRPREVEWQSMAACLIMLVRKQSKKLRPALDCGWPGGVASLPFSFGGKKLKSWAEVQQNLKDKARHEGMGVWKERGEPRPSGTLTPILSAQPWGWLEPHCWSTAAALHTQSPPRDTCRAQERPLVARLPHPSGCSLRPLPSLSTLHCPIQATHS